MPLSESSPTASTPEARKRMSSPWLSFWIASSAVFLVALDTTMLFSAFDALRRSFETTSAAELSWVLNAYTVVYAAMLIPSGGLADAYGRRRIFKLGLAVFIGASLACGAAPTVGWLIAARLVQALRAALLTPASMSIVLSAFPIEKRAVAVSLWGAVGGLAAAVGPSLGSWITHQAGWPWAFYINIPVGLWALWRSASSIEEAVKPAQRRRLDMVGLLLLMTAVGSLALAIVESGEGRWSRQTLLLMGTGGILTGAIFVLWARSREDALIDLALFKHRTCSFVNAATLIFGIAFSMIFLCFFSLC